MGAGGIETGEELVEDVERRLTLCMVDDAHLRRTGKELSGAGGEHGSL
jgi:hypothetical protein